MLRVHARSTEAEAPPSAPVDMTTLKKQLEEELTEELTTSLTTRMKREIRAETKDLRDDTKDVKQSLAAIADIMRGKEEHTVEDQLSR